jgi:microcystin-dependent protein
MSWERVFIRMQVGTLAGLFLLGMVWGPRAVVSAVLGAGSPFSGEVVPRQIPYRGYLEQNGVAVNQQGLPMQFRIVGIDGGQLHSESVASVNVQNGLFSVELGDAVPIPAEVFKQNFLELEVSVNGGPPMGRQRILTVPYAQAAGVAGNGVPAGTVIAYSGSITSAPPPGYLFAAGQQVSRAAYAELFAAIQTTYGIGDGATTFNLPDLRGRVPVGRDNMTGIAANRMTADAGLNGSQLGAEGGSQTQALSIAQMPAHDHGGGVHSHSVIVSASQGTPRSFPLMGGWQSIGPGGGAEPSGRIIAVEGAGAPHPITQPSIILNYLIKF